MNKLLSLFILLTFFSCGQDKKQWTIVKEKPRFSCIFKFGYDNRGSLYLDSAIAILNDSLSLDKNFWLKFHDDTVDMIEMNFSVAYKIPKSSVIFYNVNLNELTYIDSIYTDQNSIDRNITNFIQKIEWGGFCIYSDTLRVRNDWLSLFSTMDRVVNFYQTARENYSISKYWIKYKKINH